MDRGCKRHLPLILWQLPHLAPRVHTHTATPPFPGPRDAPPDPWTHGPMPWLITSLCLLLPLPRPMAVRQLPWNLPAKAFHPYLPQGSFFFPGSSHASPFGMRAVKLRKKRQLPTRKREGTFRMEGTGAAQPLMAPPGGAQAHGISTPPSITEI